MQPILQRRCVGCHNPDADPVVAAGTPDARGILRFASTEQTRFTRGDKSNFADIRPMRIQYKTPLGATKENNDVAIEEVGRSMI